MWRVSRVSAQPERVRSGQALMSGRPVATFSKSWAIVYSRRYDPGSRPMITRRRFLAAAGATAGLVLMPSGYRGASAARRLRSMPHPLYREPIADPTSIPRFVQPLAVPDELGMRIDA